MKFPRLIAGLVLCLGVTALPAQAQITDADISAFVEALRQAAPQTGRIDDGLYSDWQIKPGNIPRWSKQCTGKELTPTQFEQNPTIARQVLACIMGDILKEQYQAAGNNETLAVRRAASWWMTGDPNQYNSSATAPYTSRVLSYYQNSPTTPTTSTPASDSYDIYMQAGYSATQQRNYQQALQYFRLALAQRPNDSYAQQAIQNVQGYISRSRNTSVVTPSNNTPSPQTTTAVTPAATLTQQQAVERLNQWLQAKSAIFAPPYNEQLISELTTGELKTSLLKADGVIPWLKENEAYYRFGVQKIDAVNRFVISGNKATIEVTLTEDRTLYQNGRIEPEYTAFETESVRYSLEFVDGIWKISDYKTINGSLLERAILSEIN